jgi:hypothetical protein
MALNVTDIAKQVKGLFNKIRPPQQTIPPILMACASEMRPGLSETISIGNILTEMQKMGFSVENLPDGSLNMISAMSNAITKEIFRAIREDSNIQVVYKPGAASVVVQGGNAGGSMTSIGTTVNFTIGTGIIL